jgi:hypothetical protein
MTHKSRAGQGASAVRSPRAVFVVDDAMAAIIASFVATYGPGIGGAIYSAIKRKKKMFVRLDQAWTRSPYSYLLCTFMNISEDGIYLESLSLPDSTTWLGLKVRFSWPLTQGAQMQFSQGSDEWMTDGEWEDVAGLKAMCLAPSSSSSKSIICRVQVGKSKLPLSATIDYSYSSLRETGRKHDQIEFCVRENGTSP